MKRLVTMRIAWLAMVVLGAPAMGAAKSAKFTDFRDYPVVAYTVKVADVNNDGIPDVVAGGPGLSVLLGKGDGSLAPPITLSGFFVYSIEVGDFNGDGNPDIAMVYTGTSTYVGVALGNGDGTFQAPQQTQIVCTHSFTVCPSLITMADFNGDGKLDLAVSFVTFPGIPNFVTVYFGNGDGTFKTGPTTTTGQSTNSMASGDLNQDGKPDVLVSDGILHTVMVLLGNGDGTFQETSYSTASPYAIVVADFNGDGLPDVAASDNGDGTGSDQITVWLNQGGGVLGTPVMYPTNCINCNLESMAAGDFNHDGKMDLATPTSILHGNGDGTFQSPVNFIAGNAPGLVASGDLNGDGYTDLVIGNYNFNISVLLGNAAAVKQPPHVPAGYKPRALITADFNGDHIADLAVAVNGANDVRILLGQAGGGFKHGATLAVTGAGALVAADFNRDGKMDLAVSGYSGVSIFLGNGDGTFTAGAQYAGYIGDCTSDLQFPAQSCFAAADFNGDGILDLVGGLWLQGQVSFLFGNGDGTFRPGPTLTPGCNPQGLAVGDFNHDGTQDVVMSCYSVNLVVLPGNGDGTFGSPITLMVPIGSPGGVTVGDVDGDGNLDLVVAGGGVSSSYMASSQDVYIFKGNGDLTFNPPVALAADWGPNSILLTDLNGDGKPDIVAAAVVGNDVAVLLNKGDMNFAPAMLYGTNASPVMVVSADVNGDGLPDLVTVNQDSGDLTFVVHARK